MKTLLKVSPSTLENYRTCSLGKYGKTVADFINKLDAPWIKSEAQSKGDAYHKLLEHGPIPYKETTPEGLIQYRVHEPDLNIDWIFNEAQAAPAIATHTNHPDKKHEVWGNLLFDLSDYTVKVNLRVDALEKFRVWDYKTTGSKYAPRKEDYYESTQWPMYMKAYPDVTDFRYRVFHLHDKTCDMHDFTFSRDQAHENYAMMWLTHLVDFAERSGIIEKFYHLTEQNNESVRNRNAV
jgi:PD-(D/E)XK nuclease superfamily